MTAEATRAKTDKFPIWHYSQPDNDLSGMRIYDYGFRDYSPISMRFTTVDPVKDGLNWYAYVGNDPINMIDLFGLTASDSGYYDLGFSDGSGDQIPSSIDILGHSIDTAIIVGTIEVGLGVGAVVTGVISAVGTAGGATPIAAGQIILGVQLIGVGVGTLATQDVVPIGPLFTPAVAY